MISILKLLAGWFKKPYQDHDADTRAKDFEQWGGIAYLPAFYLAADTLSSISA